MKIPNLYELNERAKSELNEMDNLSHELDGFESILAQNYTDYLTKATTFKLCPESDKAHIKKMLRGEKYHDIT